MGLPVPDMSLFVIHYSKANPRDNLPTTQIPIVPQVQTQLQQRRMIQTQGQLPRKEFMLNDRANWPTITPPQAVARQGQSGTAMAQTGHRRSTSIGVTDATLEEEEDVSRGDALDFMTPRDMSRMRYEQHHDWMEEILESAYGTLQIIPTDLGLGRKGELESLTSGFFEAPISALQETPSNARVGRMETGKAEEFTSKANQRLSDMRDELQKLKERHARRMQRLQRTTMLNAAEKKLRTAPNSKEQVAATSPRTDGAADRVVGEDLDDIVNAVESKIGKKIQRVPIVACLSRGGLQERASYGASINGAARATTSPAKPVGTPDLQQANSSQQQPSAVPSQPAETSQNQPPTQTNNTATAQPHSTNQDQAQNHFDQQPARNDQAVQEQGNELSALDDMGDDVDMAGLDNEQQRSGEDHESNDWIMVEEQANDTTIADQQNQLDGQHALDMGPQDSNDTPGNFNMTSMATSQEGEQSTRQTPQQPGDGNELDTGDFEIGNDFDNVDVDTAGDALASYDDGDDELNLENMDSAFGEAFQGQEEHDVS